MYHSLHEAIADAEARGVSLATAALDIEARDQGRPVHEIREALLRALNVMRGAVEQGLTGDLRSNSGLVGGDAAKLRSGPEGPLAGTVFREVLMRAIAVQEVNAAMGIIVAAPTAGGAGVLPGVLLGLAAKHQFTDEAMVDALATAGLIGAVVAQRASLSGAEGGCQAETGAAAGMAAGATGVKRRRDPLRSVETRTDGKAGRATGVGVLIRVGETADRLGPEATTAILSRPHALTPRSGGGRRAAEEAGRGLAGAVAEPFAEHPACRRQL